MIRSLLIYPPASIYKRDPTVPGAFPPLGLAYIAAAVRQRGYEVQILDALALGINRVEEHNSIVRFGLSDKEISEYIKQYEPHVVGISCHFTAHALDVNRTAAIAKQTNPQILTIVGGAHACSLPAELLKDKNIDIVVKGEGENTFLDILDSLARNTQPQNIPGTIVKKDGDIIRNPERELIGDLDSIPFPARELLPMESYFNWKSGVDNYDMRHPNTAMVTSRGCPMKCVFCSIHSIWGQHTWRARSAVNVVDEMELLHTKYGVREIQFVDDNLTLDKKRIIQICNEIIKRKLNVKWTTPNGVAISTLDEELLRVMKKSGCYRLSFGIESGSLETQEFIGKKIQLDRTKELIRYSNKLGLWTIGFFIIGFPYETKESIEQTVQYAVNSDLDYATFYLPMPFPGTRLSSILEKEGFLNDIKDEEDYSFSLSATRGCRTKYFSPVQLQQVKDSAYQSFMNSVLKKFMNPLRILRRMRSWEDCVYISRLMRKGFCIFIDRLRYKGTPGYRPIGMRKEKQS